MAGKGKKGQDRKGSWWKEVDEGIQDLACPP